MPFRIVLHNQGNEEDYIRVDDEMSVSKAIIDMVQEKEDWCDNDTIVVFKVTDVEAKNEDFWENMMSGMRKNQT